MEERGCCEVEKRGVSKMALRRQILGYTQKGLSALVEVSPTYLCAVERKRIVPSDGLKGRILKVLGGHEDELFDVTTGLAI